MPPEQKLRRALWGLDTVSRLHEHDPMREAIAKFFTESTISSASVDDVMDAWHERLLARLEYGQPLDGIQVARDLVQILLDLGVLKPDVLAWSLEQLGVTWMDDIRPREELA